MEYEHDDGFMTAEKFINRFTAHSTGVRLNLTAFAAVMPLSHYSWSYKRCPKSRLLKKHLLQHNAYPEMG